MESAIPNQASINMGALGACENGGRTIYSLPYESDISQAPSLSLNSPVNGTYIFRLASKSHLFVIIIMIIMMGFVY